jgi:SWI/SNF chromatin-remodeling complex subunit SWI1
LLICSKLNSNNSWGQILNQFDLPEEFPTPQANGATSVSTMLSHYYMAILLPFEESYRKNLQETQRKANMANRQGMMPNMSMGGGGMGGGGGQGQAIQQQGMANNPMAMQRMGGNPMNPGMPGPPNMSQSVNGMARYPQQPQRSQSGVMTPGADSLLPVGNIQDEVLDSDIQGIKRKLDATDLDNKRARPRTGKLLSL